MEDQSTYFDTFPALFILRARNVERSVRHTPRASVLLRIKALNEDHLLWTKVRLIEPPIARINHFGFKMYVKNFADLPMCGVMLHSICLAPTIRIDEFSDNQRVIRNTVCFGNSKRITLNSFDRPPYVYDLHARLEKLVCILGYMERYA